MSEEYNGCSAGRCPSDCDSDCSSCEEAQNPKSLLTPLNDASSVKNVIAVVSGKGGVGKSLVTSLMAVIMQRKGYRTAVLDADVTGPSIPKTFNISGKASVGPVGSSGEQLIFPISTKTGIQIMSVNLLLENDTDPVVWRGPILANTVTQFWGDVLWDNVEYMFVDMPPGTGDVPLTVFQSLPIKGIIVVASPQELVGMIVEKAVKMAELMNVPVLGLVENMSYFECPQCGERHNIFGESHIDEIAKKYGIKNVAKVPVDPKLSAAVDAGLIELFDGEWLDGMADVLEKL